MSVRRLSLAPLLALAGCGTGEPAAEPTPTPTVLVTTTPARQGTEARTIEAFGEATPASNGVVTLSVQQPGQVTAVAAVAGAPVRAGQPVLRFTLAPSARSAYRQAVDALNAATSQRATTAQLLGQQLATRDQLVQADKAVADARTALAALRSEGAAVGETVLRAPFAGVVATLPVAPGDRTQPGQALATIARTGGLIVTVGVDPARRVDLRVGASVTLTRLDGGGAPIMGRVRRIDAMLNPRTRQIDVDIAYPAGTILSGEAVRVAIETGQATGWRVPHRAVVVAADGRAQLFQLSGRRAKAVPVSIVVDGPEDDLVSGNLVSSDPVIVDGAYQLGDGDPVRTGGRQ
ncbi:efflux RND transporter periplasmic adaptor subunit [Sphingomonas sp. GV3]|jgi:RND family efflux transporter MFP subunit|uniref:efflux RND transporter periplasmic adaptor subunit n=1 Tax=Sphingomonas sp. GV3 TaxID=3040671 RepID=UPI00280C29AD|nr:efflux RND transporter periplasmic adaptor subunit [Sphingomonas sp. GV3]